MAVDTILVAVGEEDRDRTDTIASTVIDIAGPTGATVVTAHVIDEETFREVAERVGEATDGSAEEVPEWARRWAGFEARIEGEVPEWVERLMLSGVSERSREAPGPEAVEAVFEREEQIQALATAFDDAGVDAEVRVGVGDPAEQVVAMAEELDADFVVVGGRNRSPARQAVFGSVSQEILRSVHCPVISVRRTPGGSDS